MSVEQGEIIIGDDGEEYLVFSSEHECDLWCKRHNAEYLERFCCNGFMNALKYYET